MAFVLNAAFGEVEIWIIECNIRQAVKQDHCFSRSGAPLNDKAFFDWLADELVLITLNGSNYVSEFVIPSLIP